MSEPNPEIPATAEECLAALRALTNLPDRFGPMFQQINLSPGAMEIYRQMIDAPDPNLPGRIVLLGSGIPGNPRADDRRRLLEEKWLAEYRLAAGPMRPFLAAVLAEPRDPLARGLLGEAMREFGWDRPACGQDARQTPPAPVTTAECLWAPEGRWSVLRGVLRWHAYGLPVADVARVGLPEYLAVREGLRPAWEFCCDQCGGWAGIDLPLSYRPCPCRGVVLPGTVWGHHQDARECRRQWRWLCGECVRVLVFNFDYQKAVTCGNPERADRVRACWDSLTLVGDDPHPDDRYPGGRERPQGHDPESDEP